MDTDYGKIAYIKTVELEKNLSSFQNANSNALKCVEFSETNINEEFEEGCVYTSPVFKSLPGDVLCFHVKIKMTHEISSSVTVKLVFNSLNIYTETRDFDTGVSDMLIMKSVPVFEGSLSSLNVVIEGDSGYTGVVNSITVFVWGANIEQGTDSKQMCVSYYENNLCVSYIFNGRLYKYEGDLSLSSINDNDFIFVMSATYHATAYTRGLNPQLYLFRINNNKELFYSSMVTPRQETYIDENITCVSAATVAKKASGSIVIGYIKNGKPYYRVFDGSIFSAEQSFGLPQGLYTDIKVFGGDKTDFNYAIVTNSNGANFLLCSIEESADNNKIEMLTARFGFSFGVVRNSIDNLNALIGFSIQ